MTLEKEQILQFLLKNYRLKPTDISISTPLFSTGLLDSFAMTEVVTFLEAHSALRFRAKDITLENLDTVERILTFIGRY